MRSRWVPTALVWIVASAVAALGAQPVDLESRYRAGVAALQGGSVFEAIDLLGDVARQDPGFSDVRVMLGQAFLAAGLPRQAKDQFEAAAAAEPTSGHVAFLLGFTLFQDARYFEAVEALALAAELTPENPYPLVYRGLSLLRLGRGGDARVDLETATLEIPEDLALLSALAELDLAEGRLEAAESGARDVLARDPTDLEATLLLGRVLFEAASYGAAVAVLRQARNAAQQRSDVLYVLAQALLRSGELDEGRATLARFVTLSAREEEMRVLESRLLDDPEDVESRLRLVRLLIDSGAPSAARVNLGELERQIPGDPRLAGLEAALSDV